MSDRGFSGSYDPRDVTFLLEPIDLAPIGVEEKERLIQSGTHYSELIGREDRPSELYHAAFEAALRRNRGRFARDLVRLAALIEEARRAAPELVLVSLARAGTPVGVLLSRILRAGPRRVWHYSVSIIRDRGLDEAALAYILARHAPDGLVFIDGWTAKGVIQRELERSLAGRGLAPELFVVADLSGTASYAATGEDYVIPSAILNATISGLVSRSILSPAHHEPGRFHGCLYLEELAPLDLSRWFVDEIMRDVAGATASAPHPGSRASRRIECRAFIDRVRQDYGLDDENYLKPGVAEATRVLLRRVPELLMVRDPTDPDVQHLRVLAAERHVRIERVPDLPYAAAALIRNLAGARGAL